MGSHALSHLKKPLAHFCWFSDELNSRTAMLFIEYVWYFGETSDLGESVETYDSDESNKSH